VERRALSEIEGKSGNRLFFSNVDERNNKAFDFYIGTSEPEDIVPSLVKAADMPENWKPIAYVQYFYLDGKRVQDTEFFVRNYPVKIPILRWKFNSYLKSPLKVVIDSKMLSRVRYKSFGPYM
jgi:hypothetical protein